MDFDKSLLNFPELTYHQFMKGNLYSFWLILLIVSFNVQAELDEEGLENLNSDYNRITEMRDAANPELEDVESLISTSDKNFLEKIQKRVSKSEFAKISKDIKEASAKSAEETEKNYLAKIGTVPKVKLSHDNQLKLDRLLNSSKKHLQTGIDFKELSKKNKGLTSVNNPAPIEGETKRYELPSKNEISTAKEKNYLLVTTYDNQSEEDKKIKRIQKETVEHLKRGNKNNLQPTDKDSLFNKVSKAYMRNLQKVIIEED